MAVDLIERAEAVLAGTFLARAVYGDEFIAGAFRVGGDNEAELNDDYAGYVASQGSGWEVLSAEDLPGFDGEVGDSTFTANGLFNSRVKFGDEDTFDAQGLLAVKGDTLVLTFRGTDLEDPAAKDGTTFVAPSLAAHYKAFRPLIDSAHDYLEAHGEISEIVVSGHSLGGAMVDIFTMVDAARFRALRPDGLTLVSLASSGIPAGLPTFMKNYDFDPTVVEIEEETILGIPTGIEVITAQTPPAEYVSIANGEDRAHFPNDFPDFPEADGLAPILTLKDNLHFGADIVFGNPNIGNEEVQYYDPLDQPFDYRGLGAEHNAALIWTNLRGLLADPLNGYQGKHALVFGVTDYNSTPDWDGTLVPLFEGFLPLGDDGFDDDRGAGALIGTRKAEYMLGLSGDDRIEARAGNDLVSGGAGRDTLFGGGGNDKLSGGTEKDTQSGGSGADHFVFASLDHSAVGSARDVIADYSVAQLDRIDISAIDANAAVNGDQNFEFMAGGAGFSGAGQIIAVQNGADTLLRFNTAGNGGSEMDIVLKNVDALSLAADQFIL